MRIRKEEVIEALKNVMDPELGIDIYTLGFVRSIDLDAKKKSIKLKMTLTSPLCPYGPRILEDIDAHLRNLGLDAVEIDLGFDPPWEPGPEVRQMLGI